MAGSEREFDLVLVTGAGASCEFGVGGARLPLMGDWSKNLLGRLRETGADGFADAVGLTEEMDGVQFEQRLGDFLREVAAFRLAAPLMQPLGLALDAPPPRPERWTDWNGWHGAASHQLEQMLAVIYESLYEQFGAPNIDDGAVRVAFENLLSHLGIDGSSRWVYATTNYDVIADDAIRSVGAEVDDGTIARPQHAERTFKIEGLVRSRHVPLMHLHGRVGWFTRPDGAPYASDGHRTYNRDAGVPIIVLPDTEKNLASDQIINAMWGEFRQALRTAERVFVLGHSLHDEQLIQALAEDVQGPLGVAVLAQERPGHDPNEITSEGQEVAGRVARDLPSATVIPMRFGRQHGPDEPPHLTRWLTA